MTRTPRFGIALGLGALAVALAGCSSSATSSSTPAATTPAASASASESAAPLAAECSKEAIQPAADQAALEMGPANVFTIDDVRCVDGWAVAMGVLGQGSTAADEPEGAPTSFVFMDEGGSWIPRPQAEVCGTDPTATAAPADAAIPADLFVVGCAVS